MRLSILMLFMLVAVSGVSQSVNELTQKLEEASSRKEKTILNYKIGLAYKSQGSRGADNAKKYADAAFSLASQAPRDYQMLAQIAILKGDIYNVGRDRRAYTNAEREYKNAIQYAETTKDLGIIAEATKKRADIAINKRRSEVQARRVYEEAFAIFSKFGISKLGTAFEEKKADYDRASKQLDIDKQKLERDLATLQSEVERSKTANIELQANNAELARTNQETKKELSAQREEVKNISEEKAAVEEKVQIAQKELEERNETIELMSEEQAKIALRISEEENKNMKLEMQAQQARNINYMIGGVAGIAFLIALMVFGRLRASRRAKRTLEEKNKQIDFERERSDELLKNILPAPIAEELKEKGKASAKDYKEVTVLFSDFKNFTKIAEKLGPTELVQELDKCFKAFDFIISKYNDIEKIKTIGDAYMCASGLSDRKTMPVNIVKAALEMQEYLQEYKQERMRIGKPYFEARIGLHTGPVVAGVVGLKKFAYDIWGDTVNIASRMETESREGKVNISDETYRRVKYQFECEYRGKVPAKNKGNIDMYFVTKERKGVPA